MAESSANTAPCLNAASACAIAAAVAAAAAVGTVNGQATPPCCSRSSPSLSNTEPTDAKANELVLLRAAMVCNSCRYGWLCCECYSGCLSCKERLKHCYCRWDPSPFKQICIFCEIMLPGCQCSILYRCKWCQVSLSKCKRGGCIQLLPQRYCEEALRYVSIFESEDGPDDDLVELQEGENGSGEDSDNMSLKSFNTSSLLTNGTSEDGRSSTSPSFSVSSSVQEEWWDCQRNPEVETASSSETDGASMDSEVSYIE